MIDKRLQRTGVGCGLPGVEAAKRDQDTAGESLRIHAGEDDETAPTERNLVPETLVCSDLSADELSIVD
jgi:hypothetical protein